MRIVVQTFLIAIPLFLPFDALCANDVSPFASGSNEPTFFMAGVRVLWGLLIVLAVMFALYAIVRKKFSFLPGNNENAVIQIVETKHLMPKKSVYLLSVRDEEYLVGVSEHSINLLSKLPKKQQRFEDHLEKSIDRNDT